MNVRNNNKKKKGEIKKMKEKIYFAGYMLWNKDGSPNSFQIVKDMESGIPCLSNNPDGLKHTENFASVYEIADDFKSARLVKLQDLCMSPVEVKLTTEQQTLIKEAV